jgi:hypothetical protein
MRIAAAAIGCLLLAGCQSSHRTFQGPKQVIVYRNESKMSYLCCKGGEIWRDGGKYTLRFDAFNGTGGTSQVELRGVEKMMLESDDSGYCQQMK